MEFLCGFLSNISRDLVCGAVNQLRYPCCFNTFVEQLQREEENLAVTRNSLQDRVAHGNKQTLKTDEVVHKWLKDADIGTEGVNNLLNKAITKKSCCFGHCPNWILRYRFGRKLANKTEELKEFNKEGGEYLKNIPQLQRVATLPPVTSNFPLDKYLKFESREYAFNEVMEAVKDEEVNLIGLYGMGGCGKTTLAEQVMKMAEAERLFDKVLLVTVSSTVEVRSIQKRIASSMQYPLREDEEKERARALWDRLTKENKILVILDDVWQILDSGDIGIPLPEHHRGCKVLITTRIEAVCTLMNCQKKIPLQILKDEEAWTLFQKQACISKDTSDIVKHLARGISDECKGLPVAIAAVAGSLKGKDEETWKVALHRLKTSTGKVYIEKGLPDPYNCLQLSYDNLDSEEAKSLFLLCSVFPEDYIIRIEVLIKLAIGLGVVGEVHSYDAAKSEVIAAKSKLVSSCLLMLDAYGYGECVKMHDLVRDVAHFIAKEENKVIKCQLENEVTLEQSSIRYLWCKEFPNDLDCSNLEFLCIVTKLVILDENFKRMGKLRVLRLINNERWNKLPSSTMSFETLTNLHCLILEGWELSDISFVRHTKKLQSLSWRHCSLPSFIDSETGEFYKQLTNLKLLELFYCEMERNNYNVIGRMSQLEELCIFDGNRKWKDCNEDIIEFFKTFSVPRALQCYAISLGSPFYIYDNILMSFYGLLELACFHISNEAIMGLAKRAKFLNVANIEGGAKNMIPDIFQMKEGSMNNLNKLQIRRAKEIECLVDTSNHLNEVPTLFSQLLLLRIREMDNLRDLWHGCQPPLGTFQKLEQLILEDCPELISLFTHTAVETVKVEGMVECEYGKEHQIQNAKVELPPAIVPSTMSSTVFQNLQEVTIWNCEKLKYVFSANTVRGLPQLKWMDINDCKELDQIIEDIIPSPSLVNHNPGPFTLSGLMKFTVRSCPKLCSLFTVSTAKTLTSLKQLDVNDCDGLKHIVTGERVHENENEDIIEDDHDLQSVNSMFSSLETVRIKRCAKLEVIFPPNMIFQKLMELRIEDCPELTSLFTSNTGPITLSGLTNLEILSCVKLSTLFTIAMAKTLISLKNLIINDCDSLKHIVTGERTLKNEKEDLDKDVHDVQSVVSMFSLETVEIKSCAELEVIFPLSCLLELVSPQISECKELKQMLQQDSKENKYLPNLYSPQPHSAKLTTLIIAKFPKLKHVFSTSASIGLSNLEILIVTGATELEELIGCEHGKGHEIEKAKVELPKLKLLIFMNLLNLCQGIELLVVKHRIVHNCPNLTLTSTTTLQELYENFPYSESEKEFTGKVDGSAIHASTTLTNLELNGISSPNLLDISQGEASIELVDQESTSEASFPDKQVLEDTINIEDVRKESIQEVSVSKRPTNKTLSTEVAGINLGGGVATHTKSSGEGILAQGSQVLQIDDKLNESNTE